MAEARRLSRDARIYTHDVNLDATLLRLGVRANDRLAVAVSGGADSVALLHMLAALRSVHVLHVDHGLRPASADDARFVSAVASELGVPCAVLRVDVEHGDSPEAAARQARYAALETAARDFDLDWIATAHTLDDQAETVLMRAVRGSGTGGLGGIRPVRGIFVRPLLDVRRDDLRAWLTERRLPWREDETNADTRFERNWIRNEVMPLVERRRAGAVAALARTAAFARADDETLEAMASEVVERAELDDAGVLFGDLRLVPRSIASRAVRQVCWRFAERPTSTDVQLMLDSDGARCGSLVARRIGGGLAIMRDPAPVPQPLPITGDVESADWGVRVGVGGEAMRWTCPAPKDTRLMLRSRRPGDRVRTRAGSRKVSDVLVDAKIPRALRDFVPILATEDAALAVVGLTTCAAPSGLSVGVEPRGPSWSRAVLWT